MIHSQDRSGWFGASDTSTIMGGWDTKTFARFWLEKSGTIQNTYKSPAMIAGSVYEHRILDALGIKKRDRQIKKYRYRLRVNLDGETDIIHEIKTHKGEFKVSKAYWQQAQVEMFAAKKPLEIVSYRLTEEDYRNFYTPIDLDRIQRHPIDYDAEWVNSMYIPRLTYLAYCLRRGITPKEVPHGRVGI